MWLGSKTRWKFNATMRDITSEYDVARSRRMQFGLHIDFQRSFAIRMGLAESSPTFGIGTLLWKRLGIDVSTYSVDISESENVTKDRRYAIELTLK